MFTEQPKFRKLVFLSCCILLLQTWNLVVVIQSDQTNTLVVFQEVGKTLIAYRRGTHLEVCGDSVTTNHRLLNDYKTGEGIRDISFVPLMNSYRFGNEHFLIVSSPIQLRHPEYKPDIVLLSQAPKINLDRYLANHTPRLIIADGSNYKSFTERWQKTCDRYNIAFHNTAKDGALQMKLQ